MLNSGDVLLRSSVEMCAEFFDNTFIREMCWLPRMFSLLILSPLLSAFPNLPLIQSFLSSAGQSHDHSDASRSEEHLVLWKGSVLLAALLLFYIFEFFMKYWQDRAKVTSYLHKCVASLCHLQCV